MSSKYINAFLLAIVILLLGSCLDKIAFTRPEGEVKELVIQALFTKGAPSVVEVQITDIFDKTGFVSPKTVNVKEVLVINDKGQQKELDDIAPGKYEVRIPNNDPDFTVDFETSYKIYVKTINNEEYESSFEGLNRVPEIDKLDVDFVTREFYNSALDQIVENKFVQFFVTTKLDNPGGVGKANLKWDFELTYKFTDSPTQSNVQMKTCFITEIGSIVDLALINGDEYIDDRLNRYAVFETPITNKFAEGYYMSVIQQSLSDSALEYWRQLREIITRTGNMFESPAGNVVSNFKTVNDAKRPVTGYFYTSESDTLRVYISPEQVGSPRLACPPQMAAPGFGCTLGLCCDCLTIPRSTIIKPAFWVE